MLIADSVGMLAACLTTAAFLPQAIMVIRTRNTEGISLVMYAMFSFGVALWLAYGLMTSAMPVIIANAITLVLSISILTIKAASVRRAHPSQSLTA